MIKVMNTIFSRTRGQAMKHVSRRIGLLAVGVSLLSVSAAQAVTVRFVAVGINGVKLVEPASTINVVGEDMVEVEIRVSDWGPEIGDLSLWQITVGNEAIVNDDPPGRCSAIKPLFFDEPLFRAAGAFTDARGSAGANGRGVCDEASDNAGESCVNQPITCRPKCIGGSNDGLACTNGCPGGVCSTPTCIAGLCSQDSLDFSATGTGGFCATADNQCLGGACVSRPDFIMSVASVCAVATGVALDYAFGCSTFGTTQPDPGTEVYAGTILLEVDADALGTFIYQADPSPGVTFVSNDDGVDAVVNAVPLVINMEPCGKTCPCCTGLDECQVMPVEQCNNSFGGCVGEIDTECLVDSCACPNIVSSVPSNCAVDARYPQEQNGPTNPRLGLDSVEVTFDSPVGSLLTASDITLSSTGGFSQPTGVAVTDLEGGTIQVDFLNAVTGDPRTIFLQEYFCLRFCGDDAKRVCWGRLPADVNGDGTSSPGDILDLIDNLNGNFDPPLEMVQCDVDISGACNPADILGVIDLLNGAGFDRGWNGATLPDACPSAPPAP